MLPLQLLCQSSKTASWQEVISISPNAPHKDLAQDISIKRPLIKKDISMSKIFEGFIKRPEILSFKVCINKKGMVTFVEVLEERTTIKNPNILRLSLNSLRKYQFSEDTSSKDEECGAYEIIVK